MALGCTSGALGSAFLSDGDFVLGWERSECHAEGLVESCLGRGQDGTEGAGRRRSEDYIVRVSHIVSIQY